MHAVEVDINRKHEAIEGTHFISSMPLRELIQKLEPAPPLKILKAAMGLNYRGFITVAGTVNQPDVFPDNWIYIHDPNVKVGRIQNFKNWSPHMVPDSNKTCLGVEYFCFKGDELWAMPDSELLELAKKELQELGLIRASDAEDGVVVRIPKAYPVYDFSYRESIEIVRQFLNPIENLQLVGRNGMHRYNNQDHSMMTAMLAVKNILGANHDLWKINVDEEYHEEIRDNEGQDADEFVKLTSTQPRYPRKIRLDVPTQTQRDGNHGHEEENPDL